MGVDAGLYMCDVIVKKFTFAILSLVSSDILVIEIILVIVIVSFCLIILVII